MVLNESLMRKRTKDEQFIFSKSRIVADRTVGFRRSKKENCSTRRGLRVGTDLVEFRKL